MRASKPISLFNSYLKSSAIAITNLLINKPSHLLTATETQEIIDSSRPLTRAWYIIDRKLFDFQFRSELLRLAVGFVLSLLSLTLLLAKLIENSNSSIYTVLQLTLSTLGLFLVFTGIGFRGKDITGDRALAYIRKYAPDLYLKVKDDKNLVSLFGPTVVLRYYSPDTVGFPSDFSEEIAGLVAIGGLGAIPLLWLKREDTLFKFCGLEEYIETRLPTKGLRENYDSISKGFEGTLDQLIEVCKKI